MTTYAITDTKKGRTGIAPTYLQTTPCPLTRTPVGQYRKRHTVSIPDFRSFSVGCLTQLAIVNVDAFDVLFYAYGSGSGMSTGFVIDPFLYVVYINAASKKYLHQNFSTRKKNNKMATVTYDVISLINQKRRWSKWTQALCTGCSVCTCTSRGVGRGGSPKIFRTIMVAYKCLRDYLNS